MSTPTQQIGHWRDTNGHRNGAKVRLVVIDGVRYRQWNNKHGKLIAMDDEPHSDSEAESSEEEEANSRSVPRPAARGKSRGVESQAEETYQAAKANPPASDRAPSDRHYALSQSSKGHVGRRQRDAPTAPDPIEKSRHTESTDSRRQPAAAEGQGITHGPGPGLRRPELNTRLSSTAATTFKISLEERSLDFVQIPRGEFPTCRDFMLNHPKTVDLDTIPFLQQASKAVNAGQEQVAASCVEKAVLIRECSDLSPRGMRNFLDDLVDFPNARRKFEATYVEAFEKVRQFAAVQSASRAAVSSNVRHAPQQQHIGNDEPMTSAPVAGAPWDRDRDRDPRPYLSGPADLSSAMGGLYLSDNTDSRHDSGMHELTRRATTGDDRQEYQSSSRTHQDRKPKTYHPSQPHNRKDIHTDMEATGDRSRGHAAQRSRDDRTTDDRGPSHSRGGQPSMGSANGVYEIKGTPGEEERLDPSYKKRRDAKDFFAEGRVFAMLWHENAGISEKPGPNNKGGKGRSEGAYKEEIFSHIRRFVVVRNKKGYCWCLGINTYGGQGVGKKGFTEVDRKAHTIIYDSTRTPVKKPHEWGMDKEPIAVKMAPDQTLDEMSRLNFGQPHTVQWNVKVLNIGKVEKRSMPYLTTYWWNELSANHVN